MCEKKIYNMAASTIRVIIIVDVVSIFIVNKYVIVIVQMEIDNEGNKSFINSLK